GSHVGLAGQFDTIDLVSTPGAGSGFANNPYGGRIGIGDAAGSHDGNILNVRGNMQPRQTGGSLTITANSDVDWYSGGFDTYNGGAITNFGRLDASGVASANRLLIISGTGGQFINAVGAEMLIGGRLDLGVTSTLENYGAFTLGQGGR